MEIYLITVTTFDRIAVPAFGLIAAFLSVWYIISKDTRRNILLAIGELFRSSYDGRGRAPAIEYRDEETIKKEIHQLTYELAQRQLTDVIPVVKKMKPEHETGDAIEEDEGQFTFKYDSTELVELKNK